MSKTNLYINAENLIHNYNYMKSRSGGAYLGAVIKANGYGAGIMNIAMLLEYHCGCKVFFVATLDEEKSVRMISPQSMIFILEGIEPKDIEDYKKHNLYPVINTLSALNIIRHSGLSCAIHFDTGMNRLGLSKNEFETLVKNPILLDSLDIKLIMTHFACADNPENSKNNEQIQIFTQIIHHFKDIPYSISNSDGILNFKIPQSIARSGIALYGGIDNENLKTVFTLKGKILQIRTIKKGETVGYGADYTAPKDEKIIIVSGGYADGLPRRLSKIGYHAFYKGHLLPLIGRVSMDTTIFNASSLDDKDLNLFDEVEFLGENISIHKLAHSLGTISYEIFTSLSSRLNRIIISPQIVA